jgi:glycosyltransferase involved in cell wall biosynthesis
MKILWLSWKDHAHPDAGGAEVVARELTRRMAAEGHEVTLLTSSYPGAKSQETVQGVNIIRVGKNRYIHPLAASLFYLTKLRNKFDLVIEEVNAAPYFSVLFGRRAKRFLFYHHLERDVWLFEARPPLSYLGYYVLEPLATRLLGAARVPLITVSESTKRDMARYGFAPERTSIISEGIEVKPLADLGSVKKYGQPTMLSLGAMRAMKRTLDQVKAFEIAKKSIPNLKLKMAGSSGDAYGKKVLDYIAQSPYKDDIEYLGRVSNEERAELMRRAHIITFTSIREGWCLVVTEAASQGTPAVGYNVHGLRDSIRHGETGLITDPTPKSLANGIVKIFADQNHYQHMRTNGWQWSKEITFDQSYKDFKTAVGVAGEA